jgi:hypothetical protein
VQDSQPSPSPSSASDSVTRTLNLLAALVGLIYLLWTLWTLIPEWQRTEMSMGLLRSSARVMTATARRAGVASLDREATTGQASYWLPYHLSLARDWLTARYFRMVP